MFEQSFIPEKTRSRWAVPLAMLCELVMLGIVIAIPLMFVQVLPVPESLSRVMLFAPLSPPPPPPPPALGRLERPKIVARKFDPTKLTLTTPKQIPTPSETAPAIQAPEIAGVTGGVPGGVLGGVPGGVPGGLNGVPSIAPPPPPPRPLRLPSPRRSREFRSAATCRLGCFSIKSRLSTRSSLRRRTSLERSG